MFRLWCVLHMDTVCTEWISFRAFELSELSPFIVSFLPSAIFSLSKKHDMMKFPRNPKTSYTLPTKEQSSGKVTFHLTYVELIHRQFNRLIHEGLF